MKLKIPATALALVASACVSQSASAYVAITGLDPATSTTSGPPTVGSTFSVSGGDFSLYVPTSTGDPTITGNDLPFYRYDATVSVVSASGSTATLDGTYQIFYDLNRDGIFEAGEPTVSSGTVALTGTLNPQDTGGTVTGLLTQTMGPSVSNFTALPSPASVNGAFFFTSDNSVAFQATLTSVPEPGTWAALATGTGLLLGVMRFRKRA